MLPCVKADIAGDTYSVVTLRGNLFSGWGPSVRLPPRLLHPLSLSLLLKKKKKKFKNKKISKGSNHLFKQVLRCGSLFLIVFCIQSSLKAVRVKSRQDLKKSLTMCFVQMRQNSMPVSIFIFLVCYHYDLQHCSSNE